MGSEGGDAELLTHLAHERVGHTLAVVDMPAGGSVPFPGLDVFPRRTLLEIETALTVEQVQVHHGMQNPGAVVCLATADAASHIAVFIDDREAFELIIHFFISLDALDFL